MENLTNKSEPKSEPSAGPETGRTLIGQNLRESSSVSREFLYRKKRLAFSALCGLYNHCSAELTERPVQVRMAACTFSSSARSRLSGIAVGGRIRDIMRLRRQFGSGRWRKLKGVARVRLASGNIRTAEVHWYEAHGIGRKKMKIKRFLD